MDKTKKSIISGMFWKFSERIAAQLVSLIVTIILARLLLPSDYGAVSLVMIFITIANVFVSDGFGSALIQKKDADQIDFSTVFYFSIAFSILLYGLIFAIAPLVANFYDLPILIPVLRVLAIKVPIAAMNSVQQAYVSRNMLFKRFFYSTLIGTIVSAVVGIALAYKGFGVWALVAQYLTNTIMDTLILWFTVKWRPKLLFSIKRLTALFSYGWKLLVQSLIVTLYGNLRSLLIGKFYTTEDLAFYTKGSYYPNLIVVNVDSAMSAALFPAMAKEQMSIERVKSIARRATKLCSYIMSPLLIGFAVCADTFVILFLTEKWLPIVPYIRIICIGLLFRAAQTATLQAMKAVGKSDYVLKIDIPVRIFGIFIVLITMKLGVIYVAISEILVAIFGLLLYSYACNKVVKYSIKEIFSDFSWNVLSAAVMGIIVYFIPFIISNKPLILLIIQIIVGCLSYLAISHITKNENYHYILCEIKGYLIKRQ
ncbi:lipopolysaccharide biosynthesis protein [Blautia glucerasea]